MRFYCGPLGSLATLLAFVVPSNATTPLENSSGMVQFAETAAVFSESSATPVVPVSCCTEATCAATCQAPACDTCNPCGGNCCGCDNGGLLGCLGNGCLLGSLDGLIKPSERCFGDMISPMTNPVFFEDPRTLTEARFIYLHHKVPLTAAGGDIDLFALQLRAALTDRLSVIATKDGYATSTNPLIDDGWADINIGLKYNLYRNPCCQTLYSVGATYELPVGSTRTLQGNGDGTFHLFSSFGTQIYGWNALVGKGFILPSDPDAESTWMYVSSHLSHRIGDSDLFFLTEFNWYNWLDSGNGGIPGVEGGDLFNLGSRDVSGNDIVTGAFGVKYSPGTRYELGVAWENPLTERRDVLENRLTVDFILRY